MATEKQRAAAKRNVKKAQAGAKSKQTLKNLPAKTRAALGKETPRGRTDTRRVASGGPQARHPRALEDGQGRPQAGCRPRATLRAAQGRRALAHRQYAA